MTLIDLVLGLLLIGAAVSGWSAGLIARLSVWLGLIGGLGASYWTVPLALELTEVAGATGRLAVAIVALLATLGAVTFLFTTVGRSLGERLAASSLAPLDRVAGSVVGMVLVAALAWLSLPAAAALPDPLGRQVSGAASSRLLAAVSPAPPDITATLREVIAAGPFPRIIAELEPVRPAGPPPEELAVEPEVVERATASTVRVSARGCGARFDGSGVTVAPGLVVTNAHVVAGSERVELRRPDGVVRPGRVVAFDPVRDLALVSVEDLGQTPLPLGTAAVGDELAVIGYPGGQAQPRVAPARVQQRRTAVGRDIYEVADTEREVLFLSAELRRGDSGAPLVTAAGEVVGVVFAVSPDQPSSAYALDRQELDAILVAPRVTGATGRCLAAP
ncbi:MAG: MarP family serine protease [Nitriliruptoraceae bacterium]